MHNIGLEYIDGLVFCTSFGDDKVGKAFGGFDKLLVHRFKYLDVSLGDHFGSASAFYGVAPDVLVLSPFSCLEVYFKTVYILELARGVCEGDREDDGL